MLCAGRKGVILLGALAVLASGCGALLHGVTTQVSIASRPSGAHTWVDGLYVGVTPIRVMLPSRDPHDVVVRAEGYQERQVRLLPRVTDGYIALDAFFFFPWSLVLDGLASSWLDTSPGRLRLRLERVSTTSPSPSPSTTTTTTTTTSTSTSTLGEPRGEVLRPSGY